MRREDGRKEGSRGKVIGHWRKEGEKDTLGGGLWFLVS